MPDRGSPSPLATVVIAVIVYALVVGLVWALGLL